MNYNAEFRLVFSGLRRMPRLGVILAISLALGTSGAFAQEAKEPGLPGTMSGAADAATSDGASAGATKDGSAPQDSKEDKKSETKSESKEEKQREREKKAEEKKEEKKSEQSAVDDKNWKDLIKKAREQMMASQVKAAKTSLDEAYDEAKKFGEKDMRVGITLWEMGQLHKDRGEYPQGESKVKDALVILKEHKDESPMLYAAALNSLAGIQKDMGNYDDSEGSYKEVISIVEQAPN